MKLIMKIKIVIAAFLLTFVTYNNLFAQALKLWETNEVYSAPESVVYDKVRDLIYVSNYTKNIKPGFSYGEHFISKAKPNGEIIVYKWIKNLTTPTGICIFNDRLYIVERFGVVEYDLSSDSVTSRYFIKTSRFINDISIDDSSNIYVSESDTDIIYKIRNNNVEKWLESENISKPNGILVDGNKLIVGVNSDSTIKSVDLITKEIKLIAQLKPGIIDGIKKIGKNYLVSHFEGNLYFVSTEGLVKELISTRDERINIADFEYCEEKELLYIPALWNNKLICYKIAND